MSTRVFGGYILGRRLGKGAQGKVFSAVHQDALDVHVGVKVILTSRLSSREISRLRNEITLMSGLPVHPNIVRLYATIEGKLYPKKNGE
jgi:serine/threonine protein kinase